MKNILIYITILLSVPLQGQKFLLNDTVKIKEVVISGKRDGSDPSGYKKITIDSLTLKNSSHGTLGNMLSQNSTVFIKGYGMGGTATPSIRGTGASHTLVAWNDININSPMLGQSDFSLIPAGFMDDVQIFYGGASMALSSGGIGGIINLETKPVWKKETLISINPGIASFGQYTGLLKVKSGDIHFQSVTKGFMQSAENDFRYLNTEISADPVWETRKNSQVQQQGFIQELYYKKTKNVLSARIWYQSANRNLPASMLSQQVNSGEKQFDESVRTMLKYDGFKGRYDYSFTGAFLFSRLNYYNRLASIDSRNLSETLILKAEIVSRISRFTILKVNINNELGVIKTNNYSQNATRNIASITASAERNRGGRFGTSILIREILNQNTLMVPDFSAGFQFRLTEEYEYFLKANISRNSKIPSMNDMFWVPGGNPGLKNEYAFMYELTYEMNQKLSSNSTFRYDLSFFRNTIKDMIQWHPGQYSYWTADNIQNVNSMGLESSVSLDYSNTNFRSGFRASYSFTKASTVGSDIISGKQLMYNPENIANASLMAGYRNLYSSWIANLTGKRYVTADNSKYLPQYILNSIITGIKLKAKDTSFDLNFTIDNLFNVNYQTIAFYPLPGRSYSFKILIQILK